MLFQGCSKGVTAIAVPRCHEVKNPVLAGSVARFQGSQAGVGDRAGRQALVQSVL